jgi:dihydroorotase (multifunctional complex type)
LTAQDGYFDLLIRHGKLVYPNSTQTNMDIGVRDGKITELLPHSISTSAKVTINASDRLVFPGFIDMHVHLRDPGMTHKEDFYSGTRAAAAGGITLVADMPNTRPPTISAAALAAKRERALSRSIVDFALWGGAANPEAVTELSREGACGIKVYMGGSDSLHDLSDGRTSPYLTELQIGDDGLLLDIFAAAAASGLPVAVHLANPALRRRSRGSWYGRSFYQVLDELRSESALEKIEAAQRCLLFASEVGAHLHLVHIPASVLPLVRDAKQGGISVTAESLLPFMTFDTAETTGPLGFDRYVTNDDVKTLWEAIIDGTIDALATDHAPHALAEKRQGDDDITDCPSGYPELDTAIAMLIDATNRGLLSITDLARLMSTSPARILGLAGVKGNIAVGNDADFTIVDPDREWIIRGQAFESRASWTPFEGRQVRGSVVTSIVRGRIVKEDGAVVGRPGEGQFVSPLRCDPKEREHADG